MLSPELVHVPLFFYKLYYFFFFVEDALIFPTYASTSTVENVIGKISSQHICMLSQLILDIQLVVMKKSA